MTDIPRPLVIYVCGPRTGMPEENAPAILGVAKNLRAKGYTVINPVDLNLNFLNSAYSLPAQMKAVPGLRADIIALVTVCNAITLMPAWEHARGCRVEAAIGITFGYSFVDWQTGELVARPARVTIDHGYGEHPPAAAMFGFDEQIHRGTRS